MFWILYAVCHHEWMMSFDINATRKTLNEHQQKRREMWKSNGFTSFEIKTTLKHRHQCNALSFSDSMAHSPTFIMIHNNYP